ncbi:MAG TPA: PhzF family phenazine biosynthesis protein [Rhizomicrobium sp.]|nr:PhzF family phenazine biosynthesis protein [Rhizomicrobium sp.]
MRAPIYQLDAFTSRRFAGNPAAVMLLESYPADALLQAIAEENNLSETAFVVPEGKDYRIRWFTPAVEVPLCGHGTLAAGAVIMERVAPERRRVTFHSLSGPLHVSRTGDAYALDFPQRPAAEVAEPPGLAEALGIKPVEVFADAFNYTALLADARAVRTLAPDIEAIARLDRTGLIVTAPGDGPYDIVSRYFAPAKGIAEDPVTGGAHCMLVPYWAKRLGKTSLYAFQASRRGGELRCRLMGDRVELRGACAFYLEGTVSL